MKKKHTVTAPLANVELVNAKSTITLDLYSNNQKLGTLEIGRVYI